MVTRNWLFVRLLKPQWMGSENHPAGLLPSIVPDLAGRLRALDAGGQWAFQRMDDENGPHAGLWFSARQEVLADLESRLIETAARKQIPVSVDQQPVVNYPTAEERAVAVALAEASSDLAIELLKDGELDADARLLAAVHHLARVVELTGGDRAAFLFHCWQQWTSSLSPQGRIDLVHDADTHDLDLSGAFHREHWQRYEARTRAIVENQNVAGYVLFDHAHMAHNRLGIDPRTEALAARLVRVALTRGTPLPSLLTPETQPA